MIMRTDATTTTIVKMIHNVTINATANGDDGSVILR
jgi:hypothetical protein